METAISKSRIRARTATAALLISVIAPLLATSATPESAAGGGGGRRSGITEVCDESLCKVSMTGNMFTPETLKVRPGTTIMWSNQDMMPHTVTSIGPATDTGLTFDSGVLNPSSGGKQWGLKLDQNGTFEYVCQLHRGMSGQVVVAGDRPESFSQTAFGLLAAAGVSGTFGALVAIKLRKKRSMP